MNRWIMSTCLAVAVAAMAIPAEAKHRSKDWDQGWQQQQWQPGWKHGWQKNDDWDDDRGWNNGRGGLFPPGAIVQDLRHKGFRDIKEIVLDDDGVIYKVRARNPDGVYVRLLFDAHNGRFLQRTFLD